MRVQIDIEKLNNLLAEKEQLAYRSAELLVENIRLKEKLAKLEKRLHKEVARIDEALMHLKGGLDVVA